MDIEKLYKNLDSPDIKLANVEFWIHGYQYPKAKDNYDANFLNVTVLCKSLNSHIIVTGDLFQTYDLEKFSRQVEEINKTLDGNAEFNPREPNISINLQYKNHGQLEMRVSITTDHLTENHEYIFEIDTSYLPEFLCQLKSVLKRHPIKA